MQSQEIIQKQVSHLKITHKLYISYYNMIGKITWSKLMKERIEKKVLILFKFLLSIDSCSVANSIQL